MKGQCFFFFFFQKYLRRALGSLRHLSRGRSSAHRFSYYHRQHTAGFALSLFRSVSTSSGYLLQAAVCLVQKMSRWRNVVRETHLFTACHVSCVFRVRNQDGALLSMSATAEGPVPSMRRTCRENAACCSEKPDDLWAVTEYLWAQSDWSPCLRHPLPTRA